jgi:D-lactate dehydrogenase
MKTFVYSSHGFDQPFLNRAAAQWGHELTFTEKRLTKETVELSKGYSALALFSSDDASAENLMELRKNGIQYLTLRSVGYDHVDLKCAEELGIKVANVPEYSPYAIAEHGVAMLLALNRKLYQGQLLLQLQDFRLDSLIGFDLFGKTIGVIGTGKIGFAFAKIMNGFGCKILAFDPHPNAAAPTINMEYVSLNELLNKSDIVSLNCPLNEHTKYMLDHEQFAQMKKGSILINTARGGVINTLALIEFIENRHLSGACLDVYEKEKGLFFFDYRNKIINDDLYSRLSSLPNVYITAHQAFLTNEALQGITDTTMYNLTAFEQNGCSKNDLW